MPTTLPHHFRHLLKAINPPEERAKAAQEVHGKVRAYLEETDAITTVDPYSRLGGSYPRDTATGSIKDVDVFIFLATDYAEWKPKKVLLNTADVLGGMPEALGEPGSIEVQADQRRSIHVYFEQRDFHLDIVPTVADDGVDNPLLVPDKELGKWIRSDPLGYQKTLSELNGEHGGKVVPLIKLHRHWRDVHMERRRPKGYWLECLVVSEIRRGRVRTDGSSYAEIYSSLLNSIYDRFQDTLATEGTVPQIPDPQLEHNVAASWERDEFEAYMRRIDESRKWAARALEADSAEAIELWRKVFGEVSFPESVEEEVARTVAAVKSGTAYVTTGGVVLPKAPSESKALRSPEHRFYGEIPEKK